MYFWKINTKPVLKGNRTCDLAEVKMGHYHCTTFSFGDGIIFAHYFQVLFSLPFKNIHLKKSTRQESNSPPHSWEDASNTSWASTMTVLKWTCHLIYMKWHLVTTWRHPVGWLLRHGSKPRAGVMTLARWATWRAKLLPAPSFFFLICNYNL